MSNDNFEKDGFIVDLGDSSDASEIINQLSNILEMPQSQNKKLCLKLGNVDLSKSQLLSVKALINSMGSELILVNSTSVMTLASAENLGIDTTELQHEIEVEPEITEEIEEEVQASETLQAEVDELVAEEETVSEEEIEEKEEETATTYVEEIENTPEVKIETRVVEEDLPEEIIETQEEKVESDYELFNPKEEVVFEKKSDAEDRLSKMLEDDEDNPEVKERREMEKEISKLPTLYIQDTLRSGQTMSYDGNVVIVGDVHPGSEIIAKGDITIWGVLGGIAHAGARGNDYARIRALKMNAIQLRISGYYARRPDTFNIPYIQRTNEFTPEEARVEDEQIAIYKIYD